MNHRLMESSEFRCTAGEMVTPESPSCDEVCKVVVGSHMEESPDENHSKTLTFSGRERQKTMDDVELLPELPGELIEKIISLIPYPRILTARALSKEWRLRLCARPSNTESVRFREMVKFAGASWLVYIWLVFDVSNMVITGFDRISWTWVTLCEESLAFEAPPRSNSVPWEFAYSIKSLGSMLCFAVDTRKLEDPEKQFLAYNIFTRAWKWLTPPPACEWWRKHQSKAVDSCALPFRHFDLIYMIPHGADSYKVLILVDVHKVKSLGREIGAALYESRSSSWTLRISSVRRRPSVSTRGAYFNGVIYFHPYRAGPELLQYSAYIVESGYWDELLPPLRLGEQTSRSLRFIVWENQLLLVSLAVRDGNALNMIRKNALILYKVDPVSGDCDVIYMGPPKSVPDASLGVCVCHGDSIFFQFGCLGTYMMEFNIRKHTWTRSPPIPRFSPLPRLRCSTTFEPGRNLFISV